MYEMSTAQKLYDAEARAARAELELAKLQAVAADSKVGRLLLERVRKHRWIFDRLYDRDHAAIDEYLGARDE